MERVGKRLLIAVLVALGLTLGLAEWLGRFGASGGASSGASAGASRGPTVPSEPPVEIPPLSDAVPRGEPLVVYLVPEASWDRLPAHLGKPRVAIRPDGRVEVLVGPPRPDGPDAAAEGWLAAVIRLPAEPARLSARCRAGLLEVLRRWGVGRSRPHTPLLALDRPGEWAEAEWLRRWVR